MRIGRTGNVNSQYYSKKINNAYNTKEGRSKDEVTFSSFGKEMVEAKKALDQVPDVRMEKVNAIKQKIESGKYNISASMIVEKMLSQMG